MSRTAERPPAARAPATRDQVGAYRFGLRRLEAALVRGDPVLAHEQVRTQRRAAFAGVVLAIVGLAGMAVYALLVPRPDWREQSIVVGRSSGALYVVARGPDRLVPVANLAAGRLVLAALARGGSANPPGGPAVPVAVADADLAAVARTPVAAVPGAVAVLPEGAPPPPDWAVCDEVVPGAGGTALRATTVVAGPVAPGEPDSPVLLDGGGDVAWLVVDGRRHRVDLGDRAVVDALGLAGREPRPASDGLVSALPEGPPLTVPGLPAGPPPRAVGAGVGEVLVTRPAASGPRYWLVLPGAVQEVPPVLADALRARSGRPLREVGADAVDRVPRSEVVPVAGWPAAVPAVREPAEAPVVCWRWSPATPDGAAVVAGTVPVAAGAGVVPLAQADGPGPRLDAAVVGPGGPVRTAVPGGAEGALWLISATGVRHGVVDAPTAQALGVGPAAPVPAAVLRLLPEGPVLDLADAAHVVDVLPNG